MSRFLRRWRPRVLVPVAALEVVAMAHPHLHVGDVIFYASHLSLAIQVSADGSVTTSDADFNPTSRGLEQAFASTSSVVLHTFDPHYGQGPQAAASVRLAGS